MMPEILREFVAVLLIAVNVAMFPQVWTRRTEEERVIPQVVHWKELE